MIRPANSLIIIFLLFFSAGCNTLYNSRSINLEVVEPGKVVFPEWVNSVAVRYNNSNVAYNPIYETYVVNSRLKTDEANTDSIASEIYYNSFLEILKSSVLFENISEIKAGNYSNSNIQFKEHMNNESAQNKSLSRQTVKLFSELLSTIPDSIQKDKTQNIFLDPEYGLYTKDDLLKIKDSTGADLLLSLDFFAMNEKFEIKNPMPVTINEYVITWWNFYDLRTAKLQYFYHRTDTMTWANAFTLFADSDISKQFNNVEISKREIAVDKAAKSTGQWFAEFLVPHWIQVSRTYYESGNVDLKKAEKLAMENKWLEAAKIWKANTKNENKNIAAKSMFNLALACEIEGNLDAAIDWVVKSYKIFEQENQVHQFNCYEYIRVLAQRKLDLKKINIQLNPKDSEL